MHTAIRVGLIVAVLGFAASPGRAHAWIVTAGRGWGPIDLGMTAREVMGILGSPRAVNRAGGVQRMHYDTSVLTFVTPAGQSSPRLQSIEVEDTAARTREGIHIRSPLSEVLRAYGDTQDNDQLGGDRPRGCLDLSLNSADRYGNHSVQPNYERTFLILDYTVRGMRFDFLIPDAKRSMPAVALMTVEEPVRSAGRSSPRSSSTVDAPVG